VLAASGGAYTVNGQSVTILRSKRITASGGAYTYAGQPVTFTYASLYPNPADVKLGVVYGPGGIYTGTLVGGGGSIFLRRR
jgi:hypothetical protein